jgi:hypothetical protein
MNIQKVASRFAPAALAAILADCASNPKVDVLSLVGQMNFVPTTVQLVAPDLAEAS